LKTTWIHRTLAAAALFSVVSGALAQRVETGLIGIKLFDKSTRVLAKYGTPDEILPVSIGGGAQFGGGGGAGGGRGGPGGPGGPGLGGAPLGLPPGGAGGGRQNDDFFMAPFDSGDFLRQTTLGLPPKRTPGGNAPSGGSTPPFGGPGGPPGGFPPSAPTGGGGAPPAAGSGERVTFTRWVYNRKNSKYAFIIDKMGRVVQIEAIGMKDANVKTSKGVSFGADFKTVMLRYANPDGYEISGDNMFVKYLTRAKVGFRFARLGQNRPQVVTGIVVAAGKS
jgi:hypothetical protein